MTISPLDENGSPVDWWFLYKVPELGGTGPGSATGYEYVYYDPNVGQVVPSPYQLTVDKGALDLTLDALFNNPSETTGWILYNDEIPDEAKQSPSQSDNGSLGHTKGVLAFDTATKTAFWLLHSWPKYAVPGVKHLPTPKYGQTYLCVSIDLSTASAIAGVMIDHQEPQVFKDSRVPASVGASDPLRLLTQTIDPNAAGDSHVLDFQSRGGKAFKLIAKNRKWGGDFWNQLVGPALGVVMDVETWIRGAIPSEQDSDAPGALNLDGSFKVFDIKSIDLTPLGAPWKWPETKDHAKWGIGVESDWVCVGDINRMISQEKRGGGAVAFQEEALWTALSKTDSINPEGPSTANTAPPPLPASTTTSVAVGESTAPAKKPAAKKSSAKKSTTKKSTTKKPTTKKSTAKKSTAKKPIAKKPAAKKSTAKKPTSKKSAAKRPTAKRPTAKRPTAKKATAKKSTAKKAAAKKPTAKKSTAKKSKTRKASKGAR